MKLRVKNIDEIRLIIGSKPESFGRSRSLTAKIDLVIKRGDSKLC